jgi:bifunctional N-acetylglucosamine-1-phosphate-uridyltransferase/glucosamine-1-phosphate-acetyltransferase GlmU-like protein
MRDMQAVILAAGKSSRMNSEKSKLLYDFNGKTIIKRVVESCEVSYISKINLIVGYQSEEIIAELGDTYNYYYQNNQIGTGDALQVFFKNNEDYNGDLLVLVGDTPNLTKEIISNLIENFYNYNLDTLITVAFIENDIPPYSRVIRNAEGKITYILEDFECSNEQKRINEIVTSQYCFKTNYIKPFINQLTPKGQNGNYYLNEIINFQLNENLEIDTYRVQNIKSVYGVNIIDDIDFLKK